MNDAEILSQLQAAARRVVWLYQPLPGHTDRYELEMNRAIHDLEALVGRPESEGDLNISFEELLLLLGRRGDWLKSDGIDSIDALCRMTETELLRTPNVGRVTVDQINLALRLIGRRLGDGEVIGDPPRTEGVLDVLRDIRDTLARIEVGRMRFDTSGDSTDS